jgi:hypothetical protein
MLELYLSRIILMLSPVIHRKWAREYLVRAERAPSRRRKIDYLGLAVINTVLAKRLEAEQTASEPHIETVTLLRRSPWRLLQCKAALLIALSLALSVVGCAGGSNTVQQSQSKSAVDPLGDSLPAQSQSESPSTSAPVEPLNQAIPIGAEPSAAAMEKMLPYLARDVYSDVVPKSEIRRFRECIGRAIFAALDEKRRNRFESVVRTGEIYNDDMVAKLTVFFRRAVASQQVQTLARALCPQYSTAIAEL